MNPKNLNEYVKLFSEEFIDRLVNSADDMRWTPISKMPVRLAKKNVGKKGESMKLSAQKKAIVELRKDGFVLISQIDVDEIRKIIHNLQLFIKGYDYIAKEKSKKYSKLLGDDFK